MSRLTTDEIKEIEDRLQQIEYIDDYEELCEFLTDVVISTNRLLVEVKVLNAVYSGRFKMVTEL